MATKAIKYPGGSATGTNTGDVTIGTANGLSIAGQVLSMAAAGAATTGAVTSAAQSIGGNKTFVNASGFGGTSSTDTVCYVRPGNLNVDLTAPTQFSFLVDTAFSPNATTAFYAYYSDTSSPATAATFALLNHFFAANTTKGAASTITRQIQYGGIQPTQGGTGNAFLTDNAAMSGNYFINQTGASQNLLTGPTSIGGATSNSSASAGFVGEILSQSRLRSAATAMTTATTLNVTATSLSLTAGDWDVVACIGVTPGATTSITLLDVGISTTTATLPGTDTIAVPDATGQVRAKFSVAAMVPGANDLTLETVRSRVSLSGTTVYFLVAQATFTVSTLSVYGSITARRVR